MTASLNEQQEFVRTPGDVLSFLALILLPSTVLWFFTFETAAKWWSFLSIGFTVFACCCQFRDDNVQTRIDGSINSEVLTNSLLAWIPVSILLIPGVILAITCHTVVSQTIYYMEWTTLETRQFTEDHINQQIANLEHLEYSWWWPPDWIREAFDIWKLDFLRTVGKHVKSSGIVFHTFFTCVYTVLHCFELASFALITTIIGRSFVHILFRVWLRDGQGHFEFSLAPGRRSSAE